jgi:hypothetical protein
MWLRRNESKIISEKLRVLSVLLAIALIELLAILCLIKHMNYTQNYWLALLCHKRLLLRSDKFLVVFTHLILFNWLNWIDCFFIYIQRWNVDFIELHFKRTTNVTRCMWCEEKVIWGPLIVLARGVRKQ